MVVDGTLLISRAHVETDGPIAGIDDARNSTPVYAVAVAVAQVGNVLHVFAAVLWVTDGAQRPLPALPLAVAIAIQAAGVHRLLGALVLVVHARNLDHAPPLAVTYPAMPAFFLRVYVSGVGRAGAFHTGQGAVLTFAAARFVTTVTIDAVAAQALTRPVTGLTLCFLRSAGVDITEVQPEAMEITRAIRAAGGLCIVTGVGQAV